MSCVDVFPGTRRASRGVDEEHSSVDDEADRRHPIEGIPHTGSQDWRRRRRDPVDGRRRGGGHPKSEHVGSHMSRMRAYIS